MTFMREKGFVRQAQNAHVEMESSYAILVKKWSVFLVMG